jgi:sugar-specific transcriptional regulator TrmB
MADQAQILQKLGLNEKESRVYLALLNLGQSSAHSVARTSGLKRPTTYVILEDLRTRGLVLKMPGSKKQMFSARSPEELIHDMKKNLADAEYALPELMNVYSGGNSRVKTVHFEGTGGIKQLMEYRTKEMRGKELVGFYATDMNADHGLVRYFKDEWAEKMLKLDIPVRMIAPEHDSLKDYREADAKYNRQLKTIPYEQYSSEVAIDVIGDIVRIQDYKNLQGVAIENADVAKTVRQIFEMVWKQT